MIRTFRRFIEKNPKLFLVLITPVAFFGVALGIYTQRHKVLLPEFLSYEKQMAANQMDILFQAIESRIHDLEMINQEWLTKKVLQAAFKEKKGDSHLSTAIASDALESIFNIPMVQLLDSKRRILFTRGLNTDYDLINAFKAFRNNVISGKTDFESLSPESFWTILKGPLSPMIVCARPYRPPNSNHILGYFFLGYPIDLNRVYPQKTLQDMDIRIESIDPVNPEEKTASLKPGDLLSLSKEKLAITRIFFNPHHIPLVRIRMAMPRQILGPVNNIAKFASLSVLVVALAMWIYFVAAFLINRNQLNRKRSEIERLLDQTRDHFSKIFHSKAVFVAITTLETGEIVEINSEFVRASGFSKEALLGKTTFELGGYQAPEDRDKFLENIRTNGFVRDYYMQLRTKDNNLIHVSNSADVIQYRGRECLLNVLTDITERKKLEEDLKKAMFEASQTAADAEIKNYQLELEITQRNQAERLNQVLFDISNAVNTTRDLSELYKSIHKILGSIVTLNNFFIALYHKKQDKVSFPYFVDIKDDFIEDVYDISKKDVLTFEVIKNKRPLFLTQKDFSGDGKYAQKKAYGTPSLAWIGVPLMVREEVIGVMVTQSYTDPDRFTQRDVNMFAAASDQIALAIERKKAQEALALSEIKHRSIIESVDDGYCEVDLKGDILFCNQALSKITVYPKESLLGMSIMALSADKKLLGALLKKIENNNESDSDIVIIQKNGIQKNIGIRPTPIHDEDGHICGYRTFVRDIDEQKKYENRLIFLAYHDTLTGLNNRKAFYEHLQTVFNSAKRDLLNIAVFYMDIDKFKKVNDTLGHEIGDILLKEIARRLCDGLRQTDFISRIGGDEFTVIMTSRSSFHPAKLAGKILHSICFPYDLENQTVDYVSASIGISLYPDDNPNDVEELVNKADQAMYEAKKTTNQFVFFKDLPSDETAP